MPKWSVDSIHSKNIVSILHLLVALARHFRAPVRLPENVTVNVVVVKKDTPNQLSHRYVLFSINMSSIQSQYYTVFRRINTHEKHFPVLLRVLLS